MIVDMSSSTSNIKNIQELFNQVIEYSQGYSANTDVLFQQWFEAKREFIESWHGQLVLEVPYKITFELSQKDKDARLDDFINTVATTFDNEELAQFIEDNRKGFFQNRVLLPWYNRATGVDIPEGMKLLKAFKYFEDDDIVLKDMQTQASMIIQEDKVEGTLCFSVHPLDFLSSSENTYNWRSCHALDGEYRAGNLSYMTDKTTIMCYLRGNTMAQLPNFPKDVMWNSKKWRMLLFFSEKWDVVFAGRQYPFFSQNALEIIMDHLKHNQMCTGRWSEWHNDQLNTFTYEQANHRDGGGLMWPYICISNELFKLFDVVTDGQNSLQFNDLLRSSCYKPYYAFKFYRHMGELPHVRVGESAPCCYCGQNHIVAPDTMLCEECELDFGESKDDRFGYCDCCDRRMIIDDAHFIPSVGQFICEWCYNDRIKRCDNCGVDFYNYDLVYDKPTHSYRCHNCRSNWNRNYAGCTYSVSDGGDYSFTQSYETPTMQSLQSAIDEFIELYESED